MLTRDLITIATVIVIEEELYGIYVLLLDKCKPGSCAEQDPGKRTWASGAAATPSAGHASLKGWVVLEGRVRNDGSGA